MLWSFVRSDLRQRYVGSSIGLFWSVINPLLLISLYTLVFSVVLKVPVSIGQSVGHYGVFLFCGMLPWIAFNEAVTKSSTVVLEQRGLVSATHFPLLLLPLYVLVSSFIHELIALGMFIVILVVMKIPLSLDVALLLVVFPLQLLLTLGLSLFVSSLNVFFRDVAQFAQAILLIWFFATPIVYPIEAVPLWLKKFFYLNPMTPLIEMYRYCLLGTSSFELWSLSTAYFGVFALLVFLVGIKFFRRLSAEFTDFL